MGARWEHSRYGLLVHGSLASVPSWAPIGQSAEWYRAHAFGDVGDTLHHPAPLVESLAHHRDRWAHIEHNDEFLPFLTFDEFDAEAWARLAADAGMGYLVAVAKHHDGLCWWDAPATDHTVLADGPRRDVLAELADAASRDGLAFGVQYSLLDWADERYPSAEFVEHVVHPQVLDLVGRFDVDLLYADGHWGAGAEHWRTEELVAAVRRIRPNVVVDDRWRVDGPAVTTFDRCLPDSRCDDRWETRRGLGASLAYNRAEPPERLLSPVELIAHLTEVVAKGGRLLVAVGPDASGRVPAQHARILRAAGRWLREHGSLLESASPWHAWGDRSCRYLVVDGEVVAIDIDGEGRFAALTPARGMVASVVDEAGADVEFDQTERGLTLAHRTPRGDRDRWPEVYRIGLDEPPAAPIELFPTLTDTPLPLADALAGARHGTIVQLGDATYVGPANAPAGVTVRGLGADRTRLVGDGAPAIRLGVGGRLEHCSVAGARRAAAWVPDIALEIDRATSVLGCEIDGHVRIVGDDARVVSSRLTGALASGVDRVTLSRSRVLGRTWGTSISLRGGAGHLVDSCELSGALTAIEFTDAVDATVRASSITARWTAVRLVDCEGGRVVANSIESTMRAVDVDGGSLAGIVGNAVADGDTGCVVQRGASGVEVAGNHWTRCRVGLLTWDAGEVRRRDNVGVDLLDSGLVSGP